jgi:hypothetical protein
LVYDRPYLIRARLEITLLINQPLVCVIMSKTTNIRTPEGVSRFMQFFLLKISKNPVFKKPALVQLQLPQVSLDSGVRVLLSPQVPTPVHHAFLIASTAGTPTRIPLATSISAAMLASAR